MKQRKKRGKKIIILSSIIVASLFMSIGYSILSQKIQLEGKANLKAAEKYLWHKITTDYISSSGGGFYENSTESKKYSYIGNGESNNIKIGNDLWKIVSIEKDHTIKIAKLDDIVKEFDETNNRTSNSTYCIDLANGCNAWSIKEDFINDQVSGSVENDSTILTYLNSEYYTSLNDELKNIIVEHSFNVGNIKNEASYNEILVQESEYTWTGKIGLLTVSEFLYPSTINIPTSNLSLASSYNNNYLIDYASGKFLWTANALSNDSSNVWTVTKDLTFAPKPANLNTEEIDEVSYKYIAIPTTYISSTVEYLAGDGSVSNPFTIKTH